MEKLYLDILTIINGYHYKDIYVSLGTVLVQMWIRKKFSKEMFIKWISDVYDYSYHEVN